MRLNKLIVGDGDDGNEYLVGEAWPVDVDDDAADSDSDTDVGGYGYGYGYGGRDCWCLDL